MEQSRVRMATPSVYYSRTMANAGQDDEFSENEFYGDFDMGVAELIADMMYGEISASSEISSREFKDELLISDDDNLPRPGIPCEPADVHKRFKDSTEEDMKEYESMHQSKSTKQNTKWAVKILQGICFKNTGYSKYRPNKFNRRT